MKNIPVYEQTTADTCLPSCLMMAAFPINHIEPDQELELQILVEGGKLSKESRTLGHLLFVCNKFDINASYYTSNSTAIKLAQQLIQKTNTNKITIIESEINQELITKLLAKGYVIVSVDDYALRREIHFPHYILITGERDGYFELIDPWIGKQSNISKNELDEAICLLDTLFYWKDAVVLEDKSQ